MSGGAVVEKLLAAAGRQPASAIKGQAGPREERALRDGVLPWGLSSGGCGPRALRRSQAGGGGPFGHQWGVGSADTPPVDGAPTPSELVQQWINNHATDKAPDGVAWGAHVEQWRGDGARDTHISAIIAATTFTKNATITAITLTDLLEDYEPPVFGVEFTHPANVQDNNGLTPLLFVLKIVYGWLHSEKMARTALLRERIKVGLLKVLKALKGDSDFLYAAPGGITALHLAIGLDYACLGEECIESLLACGCDPDAPLDESGDRPVHLAARHNPNALKPLLQGVTYVRRPGDESEEEPEASLASPNSRNFKGESPLDIAVRMRYVSSVDLLLKGGADPNVLDSDGDTPLAKAEYDQINFGGWAISTLLKDHGALALIPEEPYDEDHWTAHWEKCCTRASDRGLDDDAEESGLEPLPPRRRAAAAHDTVKNLGKKQVVYTYWGMRSRHTTARFPRSSSRMHSSATALE